MKLPDCTKNRFVIRALLTRNSGTKDTDSFTTSY